MLGAGDWQDALKESKRKRPGLSQPERFNHARSILRRLQNEEKVVYKKDKKLVRQRAEKKMANILNEDDVEILGDLYYNREDAIRAQEREFSQPQYIDDDYNPQLNTGQDYEYQGSRHVANDLVREYEDELLLDSLIEDDGNFNNVIRYNPLSEGNVPQFSTGPDLEYIPKQRKRVIPEGIPEAPYLDIPAAPPIYQEGDYIPSIKEVEDAERKYKLCKYNLLYKNCKDGKLGNQQQVQYMPQYQQMPLNQANSPQQPQVVDAPQEIKVSGDNEGLDKAIADTVKKAQERQARILQGLPPIKREVKQLTPEEIKARIALRRGKGLYEGDSLSYYGNSPLLLYDDYNPMLFQEMIMQARMAHPYE